jgi:hypothetical protein
MATFFNQKEEVINVMLTDYGKTLFASGTLMPAFYAFYDDGILYESEYAFHITESQNNTVTRISSQTPRLKPQVKFTSSNAQVQSLMSQRENFSSYSDYQANYIRVLGSSSPWSDYAPAWQIKIAEGSDVAFTGSLSFLAQGAVPTLTASLDVVYTTVDLPEGISGTAYTLEKNENIMLDIQEINTIFKVNGNFDIEVFKITEIKKDQPDKLMPLKFISDEDSVASNELRAQRLPNLLLQRMGDPEQEINQAFPILTPEYVEYYFDVRVDDEIIDMPTAASPNLYKSATITNPPDICADVVTGGGTDR